MNQLFLEAVKWILIVMITGFIAYVGRFGAQWLIERYRAKGRPSADDPSRPDNNVSAVRAKMEKKRLKAAAKAEKKRSS